MSMDLADVLPKCCEVVERASAFQKKYFRSMPAGAGDHKAVREMVSFVDVECEKILMNGLMPLVAGAGFFGEESGKSGAQDLVWIVDPLDGTTNYLSGIDHFSISVALVKDGEPVLGVVHKPMTGETWHSVKGSGLFYNDKKLERVSKATTEKQALFVTGFPYRSQDLAAAFFSCANEVLLLGRGIRRTGSAALDSAHIACGWYQGFWESDLQAYDVAAAILLMQENGCVVTNELGAAYNLFEDRIMVAALPGVHGQLRETVAKHYSIEN